MTIVHICAAIVRPLLVFVMYSFCISVLGKIPLKNCSLNSNSLPALLSVTATCKQKTQKELNHAEQQNKSFVSGLVLISCDLMMSMRTSNERNKEIDFKVAALMKQL